VSAVAVLAVGLAACSQVSAESLGIEVTGEPGQAPVITYVTPLEIGSTFRETLWAGTGPLLVEGGTVLIDIWLENASDGTVVKQTYMGDGAGPKAHTLAPEDLGEDLYRSLRGQRVGARVLQVAPPDSSGTDYSTVAVIDVLPLRADGTPEPQPVGLPVVTLAEENDDGIPPGTPSITPTGTDPPTSLTAQLLRRGDGAQVGSEDDVTFQFAMFTWSGEVIDSSWTTGGWPVTGRLYLLPRPLADGGLFEKTVGSQVILVVPPTEGGMRINQSTAYENQTIVVVIDILSTRTPPPS
jgi:peptidylprolyl isomerase